MNYAASVSEFSGFEGVVSSTANSFPEMMSRRLENPVATLFPMAGDEVGHGLAAILHVGPAVHAGPHQGADLSVEKGNFERTNIMIALRKYLAGIFAFNASRPTQMRGRRFKPEVGHEWTDDAPLVKSLAAGQMHLNNDH